MIETNVVERIPTYLRQNAGAYAMRFAAAFIVLVIAIVLGRLIGRSAQRAIERARGETLAPVVRSLISTVAIVAGIVMAADQIGINVSTVLAGAGILGLAVGFGAQTLVKDCISGFFLIFDKVLAVGDAVEISGVSGTVERVGLRMTRIRAFDGRLWYVPNGSIGTVANASREWLRAVVDLKLPAEYDVSRALDVLQRVGDDYARERPSAVIDPPTAQGPISLSPTEIGVRLVIKVAPAAHAEAERELRRRVKLAWDAAGFSSHPPPTLEPGSGVRTP